MMDSIFCAHMVSMPTPPPNITYDAAALIKKVYDKIKPNLGFLQMDNTTGFITLKDPNPPLDKFPSVSTLEEQINKLTSAISTITTAKNAIKREENADYPLNDPSIPNKITHVKAEMDKDVQRTDYAAHVYVLNCLLHVKTLLEERKFKAIYMETINAAQEAGADPFY